MERGEFGGARYVPPSDVAWIDGEEHGVDDLFLTRLPDGETVVLSGSARLIWHAAVGAEDVAAEVAHRVGLRPDEVAGDVAAFLAELTARGLLTPAATGAPGEGRDD